MKALIIMLFAAANIFACDCQKLSYKHKSEAEIAAMTPAQRIDEMVSEQLYHMPSLSDETADIINDYIHKDGLKIVPILTEYLNDYDPGHPDCEDRKGMRFFVAGAYLGDLDSTVIRLRASTEGRLAIDALEMGLGRMKSEGFDKMAHSLNGRFRIASFQLDTLKGANGKDEIIIDTLRLRHRIEMSEGEMLEFIDFLTALDPTYPSWSMEIEGTPRSILVESNRYYDAYLKFKDKKSERKVNK